MLEYLSTAIYSCTSHAYLPRIIVAVAQLVTLFLPNPVQPCASLTLTITPTILRGNNACDQIGLISRFACLNLL